MCIPFRQRDPRTRFMMVFGNFCLVAGFLIWIFSRASIAAPHLSAGDGWIDGISGFLFGVSIGANLWVAMRLRRCEKSGPLY